jgi:hypothetical protein
MTTTKAEPVKGQGQGDITPVPTDARHLADEVAGSRVAPFFILGCVRSGTTMLRNILRKHPNFASPEETQFYRWGEPYRGPAYSQIVQSNPTLRRHRQIDGITEAEFKHMLEVSTSRADLYRLYMARFIEVKAPKANRWFDKSPQNVYGAGLIAAEFPSARFLHIVRDPVNVVASLRIGKVMKMDDLVGACSYWNEAASNIATLKRAWPGRVLELKYEDFTADPLTGVRSIMAFLREPFDEASFASVVTAEVRHEGSGVLSDEEMAQVRQICLAGRIAYGYDKGGILRDPSALALLPRDERQRLRHALRGRVAKKGPAAEGAVPLQPTPAQVQARRQRKTDAQAK